MIRRPSDGREFFVVGCHAHAGESSMIERYCQKGRRFLIEETVSNLDHYGMDASVVFAVSNPTTDYSQANAAIMEGARRYADRIIPFARLNPNFEGSAAESVAGYVEQGFRGLKLHCFWEGFAINDPVLVRPIMEEANRFGLVVLFHTGEAWTALPGLVWDLALDYPDVKFIIGHSGQYGFDTEAWAIARRTDNVWLDTTELYAPARIRTAASIVGADRILFGTDTPYINTGIELEKVFRYSELTDDELDRILAGNLAELLDIRVDRETYGGNVVDCPFAEPIFLFDEEWVARERALAAR